MQRVKECKLFNTLGKDIKSSRQILNMSRKDLAEKLNIDPRYLANIENSGSLPSLPIFYELIRVCRLPVEQYFFPPIEKGENPQSALAIERHPKEIHERLIAIYWEFYNRLGDEIYLEFAYTHIGAFLRSGSNYRNLEPLFTEVIKAAGYQSLREYFHAIGYKVRKVRLTRNRIHQILGNGVMLRDAVRVNKKEIVDEILRKIVGNEIGTHCYVQEYNGETSVSYLNIDQSGAYLLNNRGEEFTFFMDDADK